MRKTTLHESLTAAARMHSTVILEVKSGKRYKGKICGLTGRSFIMQSEVSRVHFYFNVNDVTDVMVHEERPQRSRRRLIVGDEKPENFAIFKIIKHDPREDAKGTCNHADAVTLRLEDLETGFTVKKTVCTNPKCGKVLRMEITKTGKEGQ